MKIVPIPQLRFEERKEKEDQKERKEQFGRSVLSQSQISKIVSKSPGALFPAEKAPEGVMQEAKQLKKGIEGFLKEWAGKKRAVQKIPKKKSQS